MENHSVFNSKELANDIVHFIEERNKTKGSPNGLLTGIEAIDDATEGIKPGQVITITDDSSCRMSLFSQLIEIISLNEKNSRTCVYKEYCRIPLPTKKFP